VRTHCPYKRKDRTSSGSACLKSTAITRQVIAWGMSLERPTMIKYGYDNIRDLFGHRIDLNMVRKHPIVRWT
jgi:O-phosphoseryl-tRNA(Cys) synthetase